MVDNREPTGGALFTIGHSNHSLEVFLSLLSAQAIEVVVDTRSQPYSRYSTQFNGDALPGELSKVGIKYLFMGNELGGRPKQQQFYDDEGHVLYSRLAQSDLFQEGIERVEKGINNYRVALMCSEEDPTVCHRFLLIGRVLKERGAHIQHIRGDGRLQSNEELESSQSPKDDGQLMLFEEAKETPWRSLRSVLPKSQQPSSSKP
jgi:uncharacterized protein (DUF488 family)